MAGPVVQMYMLTTLHLSATETLNWRDATTRDMLRQIGRRAALKAGRRFVQVVGANGQILAIFEVRA